MFKKFEASEDIGASQQLKSSVQKNIRNRIIDVYPLIEPYMENILPKKDAFKIIKCKEHVELLASSTGEVLFFKTRDNDFIPTLKLLHMYPFMMPWQQVDKGAIKFVLKGSNIMCPGLTSPGASMTPDLPKDSVIAVMAEGKQHALGIGIMIMSSQQIKGVNKGIGVETVHFLNDGLWRLPIIR